MKTSLCMPTNYVYLLKPESSIFVRYARRHLQPDAELLTPGRTADDASTDGRLLTVAFNVPCDEEGKSQMDTLDAFQAVADDEVRRFRPGWRVAG